MEQPLPLTPSPADIRQELQDLIIGDLLGPAGGEDEEIPGRERVRDRYVLGALAPKDTGAVDPERSSSDEAVEGDDSLGHGRRRPGRRGPIALPFEHGVLVRCRRVRGEPCRSRRPGARTRRSPPRPLMASGPAASGAGAAGGGSIRLPLGSETIGPLVPDPSRPEVVIRGRVTTQASRRLISVFLVNEQPTPLQNRDEGWLFQAVLRLAASDGSAVFLARDGLAHATEASDPELPQLDMLYRDEVEFAVGHGTAVHVKADPADPRGATVVESAAAPVYDVPRTEAPSGDQVPELAGLVLDMSVLARAPQTTTSSRCSTPLVSGYGLWLDRQQRRIAGEASLHGFEAGRRGGDQGGASHAGGACRLRWRCSGPTRMRGPPSASRTARCGSSASTRRRRRPGEPTPSSRPSRPSRKPTSRRTGRGARSSSRSSC